GMRGLPASATSAATWPLLSWANARKMKVPALTTTMLAPMVKPKEPILRMEAKPSFYGRCFVPVRSLSLWSSLAACLLSPSRTFNSARSRECREAMLEADALRRFNRSLTLLRYQNLRPRYSLLFWLKNPQHGP